MEQFAAIPAGTSYFYTGLQICHILPGRYGSTLKFIKILIKGFCNYRKLGNRTRKQKEECIKHPCVRLYHSGPFSDEILSTSLFVPTRMNSVRLLKVPELLANSAD
jgi:hypothetical protein